MVKKLGEVAEFTKGIGYSKNDIVEEGSSIILYGSLYTKYKTVIEASDNYVIKKKGSIVSTGKEVIVPASGETAEDISRASAVVNSGILLGGDLNIIYPQKFIDTKFLALTISNGKVKMDLSKKAQGKSVVHIHNDDLSDLDVSLPSLPEQELIGNYFKHLDELINSKEKKIAKLKSIKAACLDKMFPKEGEAVPQLRFKGFNEDWVVKKLGEVIEVNSGRDYKHLSEGSIPVYGTGGYMLSVNDALSYKENAIGIGRKGTIDKPYILYAPFWTVDTLFYTIPKNGYNLNFIFDIFQNIDWKKKDESTGVPSLSKNAIIQIDISLPTLPEQELIGNYFKHLDELIEKSERQLEKLKSIKQGCLDKMFIND